MKISHKKRTQMNEAIKFLARCRLSCFFFSFCKMQNKIIERDEQTLDFEPFSIDVVEIF